MAIPTPVMQTLATLIIDGILERHPALMFGVIEQGAGWLPSWMRYLDSAHAAFARMEERLQKLSLKPSEYVRRQIRATPYPTEDVGWILREAGPEIPLFSSDFPHVEGGRNPVKRFESTLEGVDERAREAFYRRNFEGLMGSRLAS
jgi:predicted TIM-barrel fold metal-dependent hydrolase